MRIPADPSPTPASAVVNFGAMSCTESCVATLLNLMGLDYRYLFLDYWNLFYEAGTLLSGRNLDSVDLDFLYGIGKERRSGLELEECAQIAADPHSSVLLLTKASRLPFFPRKLLAFEENGFDHYVLIHGYDSFNQAFMAIDPIAGFTGAIPLDDLRGASTDEAGFRAWVLTNSSGFRPPAPRDLILYVGRRNYMRSLLSQRSFQIILEDVDGLTEFSPAEKIRWVERNNVAITSIIKNRRLVWRSFATLELLSDEQKSRWDPVVRSIIAEWTHLNLLLFKWVKANGDASMLRGVRHRLESIQAAEREFLFAMNTEGRK